jgi:hypothetical protein
MKRGLIASVLAVLVTVSWTMPARAQSFGLYDNFGSGEIDPLRWRGYEYRIGGTDTDDRFRWGGVNDAPVHERNPGDAPSAALDSTRRVVNGQAQIALTAFNRGRFVIRREMVPTGKARSGLRLNSPGLADHSPMVTAFRSAVTVAGMSVELPQSGAICSGETRFNSGRVQIFGHFFNDGSSIGPDDLTGDVVAAVSLERVAERDPATGARVVRDVAEARVGRCQTSDCGFVGWQATPFTRTWTVGVAHVLTIVWRPGSNEFMFTLAGGGVAAESLTVPTRTELAPPRGYVYDLRVEAQPIKCEDRPTDDFPQRVSVDARFDNVHLDSTAAAAR